MNLQFAQMFRDYPMHYGYDNENSWLTFAWFILITFVVVAGIILLAKYIGKSANGQAPKEPLDIAKERYAKGEITKEDLADIKKELKTKD